MHLNAEITIDLVLILRLLLAGSFGGFYAIFLEFSAQGRYLAKQLTWLAVVIGVGVDLAIAYNANWWTTVAVVAFSSVGIIARSLVAASRERPDIDLGRYKTKWVLDDLDDDASDLTGVLSDLLRNGKLGQMETGKIGVALAIASRISNVVNAALMGRYEQRRPR